MKMTVQEVMNAYGALRNLGALKMPAKAAYRVARLMAKLRPEAATVEERRTAIIRELGAADDANGGFRIDGAEKVADFHKRMSEILAEEIDLPGVEPIPFDQFGEMDLSPQDIADMGSLIQ